MDIETLKRFSAQLDRIERSLDKRKKHRDFSGIRKSLDDRMASLAAAEEKVMAAVPVNTPRGGSNR